MKRFIGLPAKAFVIALIIAGTQTLRGHDNPPASPAGGHAVSGASGKSPASPVLKSTATNYGHGDDSAAAVLQSNYTTEHFIFHFSEDKSALGELFAALENNYSKITKAFGINPANKVKVEIYPDIKLYHRRTFGENSPDWMVGNFDPDNNVVRMVSPNNPGSYHDYKSVVEIAAHEFAHCVTFEYRSRNNKNLPNWLNEGLSLYYADQFVENDKKRVKEAVASNDIPALSDLKDDFVKYHGYTFSYTVVDFIIKKYGEKKLMEFVKNPDSYGKIFSMSKKKFNAEWQAYLKEEYKQ